jgi:acyl-CoA thioester hydrolase
VSNTTEALDPAKSTSTTTLRVRFNETDLMGIVHHATYLVYFEAGRVEWLRRRGLTYVDWTSRGLQVPVASAELRYRAPSRFDDVLEIETTLVKLRSVSLDLGYRIVRGDTLVAEGLTRLACIGNDGTHGLVRIPEDIRSALLGGEHSPVSSVSAVL